MNGIFNRSRLASDGGRLDRRIQVLFPTVTAGADGSSLTSWGGSLSLWASYIPEDGREMQQASQKLAMARAKFRVRYRTGLSGPLRVKYRLATYELIAPPVEVGREQFLDLLCEAIDPSNVP